MNQKVVTVAMTGASGAVYAMQLLKSLFQAEVRVNLLLSSAARIVIKTELSLPIPDNDTEIKPFLLNYFRVTEDRLQIYGKEEWTAPVASGSNPAQTMIICPCSMGTLSAISNGASNNLIERAADVMIKERKQLILLTREMPYSSIHLENMFKLSKIGVTIMPASPGFYHNPQSIEDLVNFVVARILDHIGINQSLVARWG
jgi:4-hydroxy-3-polyprenylbenzoate decarboxylase